MTASGFTGRIPGRLSEREGGLVELVTTNGDAAGLTTVAQAHEWPGLLHRAFSVLLVDDGGRLLLQRRAAVKTRFALRWANSCCGHPAPGQNLAEAAVARVSEELGVHVDALQPAGVYVYRAGDPATGRVEHEYDHVLVGRLGAGPELTPDPREVADVRWIEPAELRTDMATNPASYAPWLAGVVSTWHAQS